MPRHTLTATLALALALGSGAALMPSASYARADSAIVSETYNRAEQFMATGKTREAAIELKNVLRENPDHAAARLLLGKISLGNGDLEGAEKEIGRAHRLNPTDESAVLLGELALQSEDPARALALVEGAAATQDFTIQKMVVRGAALVALNRLDEAERVHEEIIAIDPRRVEGHFGLARVFVALRDYTRAADKIDEIVRGKPDYAPGWILRGEVSLVTGDKHAAFLSFDKAVALQPDDTVPLISRARASLANGDLTRARQDARAVRRLTPNAPIAHYLDAAISFAEGDYDAANNSFTQLQRNFDRFAPAVLLGALIKTERSEYSQADSLFQRYISMQPDNLDARRALATVRMRMGQPSNAADILERLLARSPDDTGTRRRLASAYLALDRFDSAKEQFEVLAQSGSSSERNDARTALALLEPEAGENGNALRIAVLKAGDALSNDDPGAANAVLDALDSRMQSGARVLALRGGIAAAEGDIDEARRNLDQALRANPELVVAHAALEQLDTSGSETADRLRNLLAARPNSEFLTLRLARQMLRGGNTKDGVAVLREGTRRVPGSIVLSKALVSALMVQERSDEAVREAVRLAAMPNAALGDISFAALSMIDVGAGDAAIVAADRLVANAPDSPRAVIIRAEALATANRVEEAYTALRNGLKRWPSDTSVAGTMASLAIKQRNAAVAQEAAQTINRTNPSAAARLLANAAGEMGQPVVGVQVLEQAFANNPDGQLAAALYGARVRAGRMDAARDGLRDWVRSNPRDRTAMLAYATGMMEQGDYAEAETVYGDFLKLEPTNPVALNNYAWLRHRAERPDALDYAQRAFEAASGSPEIADTYGWMLVEYGKLDQGLLLLSRAVEMAPDNPEIGYHYAAALSRAGRGVEARTILTGVLDGSGNFDKRGEAESLLSTLR